MSLPASSASGKNLWFCCDDLGAPLGEARDDLAFGFERGLVRLRGCDVDIGASQEAMTVGGAPGFEPEHRDWHDVGAVQRDQSMRRPNELDRRAVG